MLNEKQIEAVEKIEGPLLILAGAGSGKTTVLVHRIAKMREHGISTENILAVTFTNKAANEMRHRLVSQIGEEDVKKMWISTFHALCTHILREEWYPDFSVISTTGAKQLLKEITDSMTFEEHEDMEFFKPHNLQKVISLLKNEMMTKEAIETGQINREYADMEKLRVILGTEIGGNNIPRFRKIFSLYEERLANRNLIDVDDILLRTAYLLIENEDILNKYHERFHYIMVDEYQDTNRVQYVIVKLLAQKHRNLGVVGDDFQSIYAFRGSDIRNILKFEEEYPEATVIKLEENYRSTKTILLAANQIIAHNKDQKEKTLYTSKEEGRKIGYHVADFSLDEAQFVAEQVKSLISSGEYTYRDIAVFYRNNSDSSAFETVFAKEEIPFVVSSEAGFFEREEIRDILAYLKFIVNPRDQYSFARIVNLPKRGIGKTTIDKLIEGGKTSDYLSFSKNPVGVERLNTKTKEGLAEFVRVTEKYKGVSETMNTADLISSLIEEIDYKSTFEGLEKYTKLEKENYIQKLLQIAMEMNLPLAQFLEALKRTDVDSELQTQDEFDRVNLLTIHSSKGLEFPIVFLIGMKKGTFPSQYSLVSPRMIEEERRLCYVAFTRAKKRLFLSYPKKYKERRLNEVTGEKEEYELESIPSQFLEEFEHDLLETM